MSTFVRRGLIVLGFSTIVGVAFVPLGDSGWADGIRAEQAEPKREATQSREEPPLVTPNGRARREGDVADGHPSGIRGFLAMGSTLHAVSRDADVSI